MSLQVAFHLRRLTESHAAWAVLVPSRDVASLWKLCGRLGVDPIGRVHDVAGGYLLKLDEPTRVPLPGMIRLRMLAGNLFDHLGKGRQQPVGGILGGRGCAEPLAHERPGLQIDKRALDR